MRTLGPLSSLLLVIGALLALSGCSSSVSPLSGQDSVRTLTLSANTNWVLTSWTTTLGDKQAIAEPAPTLTIGYTGQISGDAGVNRYTGTARIANNELNWGTGFALTRRAGPPELMMRENKYLNSLRSTKNVTVRGNKLVFTGDKPLRLEYIRASN
jgi:heat shock protein HslJ